jgi:hypothetical protein
MAYLNGSCPALDTPKLLISTWIIVPVGTIGTVENGQRIDVLSIGDVETWTHYVGWASGVGISPFQVKASPAVWLNIFVTPIGEIWPELWVRGRMSSMNHTITPGPPIYYPLTPLIVFAGNYLTPGVWNHLLMSVDLSGGPTSMPYLASSPPLTDPDEFGPLSMYSQLYINGALSPFWNDQGFVLWNEQVEFGDQGGSNNGTSWNMAINGSHFQVHGQRYEDGVINGSIINKAIRLAEMKVWFGVAPDLSIHVSKFISSTGHAVDPSAAISAFGTPAYHFRRKAASGIQFGTNLGTAGAMTQVGTIPDFFPGVP